MFQFVYLVPVVIYCLVVLNICSSLYISFLLLYITWLFGTFVPVCIYSSCCYILPGGFKHLFQFVYIFPVVIYYLVVLNTCSSLYIYFLLLYITWWFETFVPVCIYSSCCYILPGGFKHLFQIVYIVPGVIYYLVFLNIGSSLYI